MNEQSEQLLFNMDPGLNLIYDGGRNTVIGNNRVYDYPCGGVIAEYMRLKPAQIKQMIMKCNGLSEDVTVDNVMRFFTDFQSIAQKELEPVQEIMVMIEFENHFSDWFKAVRENRTDELLQPVSENIEDNEMYRYIFEGTGYEGTGAETVGQLALSAYLYLGITFVNTRYIFQNVIDADQGDASMDKKALEAFAMLYSNLIATQHIDYRIVSTDKALESLYTIKTSMSLLLFEMAHCINRNIMFVKCKNCGQYFVPDGRADQIYCTYTSPQNINKTCREVGAQIAWANKEKNDEVTRAYRKAYMRRKMYAKRHPESRKARQTIDALTEGMAEWRIKLAEGSGSVDQFMEWIQQY